MEGNQFDKNFDLNELLELCATEETFSIPCRGVLLKGRFCGLLLLTLDVHQHVRIFLWTSRK